MTAPGRPAPALSAGVLRRRVVAALGCGLLLLALLGTAPFAGPIYAGLYLLANFMLFADLFDLIVRRVLLSRHTGRLADACPTSVPLSVGTFTDDQIRLHLKPYAFLVAVHDLGDDVEDFIDAMQPLRDRIWVIDDASTDSTAPTLLRAGFRCVRGTVNQKKPGAIRQLLRQVDPRIRTIVVMDPDCRLADEVVLLGGLERRIFEFQRSGMAALTPRVRIGEAGLLATLQAFEYGLTFSVLRKSLGDHCVTSGVSIYRRDALEAALENHHLSVYAEDLENAVILLSEGERIYYDERLIFETVPKRSWKELFSQRVGWSFGLLHVYASQRERLRSFWRRDASTTYHFLVYAGGLSMLLHPLRLVMVLVLLLSTLNGIDVLLGLDLVPDTPMTDPSRFVVAYVQYTILMTVLLLTAIRRSERARLGPAVPIYFFYALLLVVPTTLGYLNWLSLRLRGRRVYDDHYDRPGSRDSVLSSP